MGIKSVVAVLVVSTGLLSGCVGYVYPVNDQHRAHRGSDIDRDGVPNRYDRDRDGDGVRNRQDRAPNNSRRY